MPQPGRVGVLRPPFLVAAKSARFYKKLMLNLSVGEQAKRWAITPTRVRISLGAEGWITAQSRMSQTEDRSRRGAGHAEELDLTSAPLRETSWIS
jgi:hypothetical protein